MRGGEIPDLGDIQNSTRHGPEATWANREVGPAHWTRTSQGPFQSELHRGAVIFYLGDSYLANPQQHITANSSTSLQNTCYLIHYSLIFRTGVSEGITRWIQLWRDLVSRDLWQLTTFLSQPTWHFIFFYPASPTPISPHAQRRNSPLCCTESEINYSKVC